MNNKYKELIDLLISKTENNIITWSYASSEDSFRVELTDAFFVISYFFDMSLGEGYGLSMSNGTGKTIDLVSVCGSSHSNDFESLKRLYLVAKDSCTQETATIDKAINELKSLKLPDELPF